MNATKRLALAALSAGILLALAIVPAAQADVGTDSAAQTTINEQRQHMLEMRNIMHFAAFTAQPTENGVTVSVTSPDPTLEATIREEFGENHTPASPVEGSEVAVSEVEGGAALAFTSNDPAIVKELQAYGPGLGYALLRNNMHATMLGLQSAGGFGPGMMGRQGYGTQGYGPGYGRGMMGGYGPGWMHGGGMMGGYGPGWMHGGPWGTPQAPADEDRGR